MSDVEVVKWSDEVWQRDLSLPRGSFIYVKMQCLLCNNLIGIKGAVAFLKEKECPWCGKKLTYVKRAD